MGVYDKQAKTSTNFWSFVILFFFVGIFYSVAYDDGEKAFAEDNGFEYVIDDCEYVGGDSKYESGSTDCSGHWEKIDD